MHVPGKKWGKIVTSTDFSNCEYNNHFTESRTYNCLLRVLFFLTVNNGTSKNRYCLFTFFIFLKNLSTYLSFFIFQMDLYFYSVTLLNPSLRINVYLAGIEVPEVIYPINFYAHGISDPNVSACT